MTLKRTLHRACLLLPACAALGAAESALGAATPLPTPFPEVRYQRMSAKSPFAVSSGAAAPAASAGPGFASQLYISAVAQIGEKDFVTVKSRDPDKPLSAFLEVGGTTADGMKVQSVKWSDERAKTTVTVISTHGEKATLAFDQQEMDKTPAIATPPAPAQPFPPTMDRRRAQMLRRLGAGY